MTPAQQLYEAIKRGDLTESTALVAADPSLIEGGGPAGMPPLMLSIYMKQPAIAEMLLGKGAAMDAYAAAAFGKTDALKAMLAENEALLREHSSDGWTILHLACFFGHPDTAQMLIEKGASVHDQSANTLANKPLHAAVAGRNVEIIALLLASGADVNARQHAGYSALHAAAVNGDEEIVRMLLAHQADPLAGTEKGETPISMARDKGHSHVVQLLESAK